MVVSLLSLCICHYRDSKSHKPCYMHVYAKKDLQEINRNTKKINRWGGRSASQALPKAGLCGFSLFFVDALCVSFDFLQISLGIYMHVTGVVVFFFVTIKREIPT